MAKERPELEVQKNELIVESASNKAKLKEIEDKQYKIRTELAVIKYELGVDRISDYMLNLERRIRKLEQAK